MSVIAGTVNGSGRSDLALKLRLTVPFGTMENRPRLSEAQYEELLALNRSRYCATAADHAPPKRERPVEGFKLGRPEVF